MKLIKNEEIITKDITIKDEYDEYGITETIYYNNERYIIENHFYPCDNVQCYTATKYNRNHTEKVIIYLTKNDDDDFYYCTIETYEPYLIIEK